MKLLGNQIYLKFLQESHIADYLDLFSPRVQEILGVSSRFSEQQYIQEQCRKQKAEETFFFCIFEKSTDLLIGSLEIRANHHRGQLCTWIHENYWGKGYFKEAFALAKEYYFKKRPQETNITARVDRSNQRSYQALMAVGCTVLGMSRGPREDQYEFVCGI